MPFIIFSSIIKLLYFNALFSKQMHALESSSHLDPKLEFQQKMLCEIRGELL